MEVEEPQVGEVTCLGGVTRLSIQSFILAKGKTQAAVTNFVNFRIFINLTFRMLFNIHFQK